MNIFVGNLSFEANQTDLQREFMAFGLVTSVVIVMEKKGKKSRGFGFVEMPDEQEALAAIAQLQGKEILGRPVNVMAALPKKPKSEFAERKNNPHPEIPFKRTGEYRKGRRSLSYAKQRINAGITAPITGHKNKINPMRWRKKPRWTTPSSKPEGELKPWQRPQTESNPWKKPRSKSGAWKKPKPWKKTESAVSRPWKKTAGKSQSWRKSSADRQQSGFKKRSSLTRYKK